MNYPLIASSLLTDSKDTSSSSIILFRFYLIWPGCSSRPFILTNLGRCKDRYRCRNRLGVLAYLNSFTLGISSSSSIFINPD